MGVGPLDPGLTNTHDALAELDQGPPLPMVFLDADAPPNRGRGTVFFPNIVALVKGSPNPGLAKMLIDSLFSRAVEKKPAEGEARQIPLNPSVQAKLPGALQLVSRARPFPVDFARAADVRNESQLFLNAPGAAPDGRA